MPIFVGNDTENFNPLPSGLDFITVHSSQVMANGFLNTGLFINYAGNVLPDAYTPGGVKVFGHDTLSFTDVSFAYGLFHQLELDATFSSLLSQSTDENQAGAQFSATGLNEIRLGAKYEIIPRLPYGLAAVVSVNVNQATDNPFVGSNAGPTLNLEGVFDAEINKNIYAFNFGYRIRDDGAALAGSLYTPLPNEFIASIAMSHYFPSKSLKLIGEIEAAKGDASTALVDSTKISSEALLGGKYDYNHATSISFGAGTRVTEGLFTPDWRVYVGANFAFDLLRKPQSIMNSNVELHIHNGYQPNEIESLKGVPFDEIMKTHEFDLRKAVGGGELTGAKPPFELVRLDNFDFDTASSVVRPDYSMLLDQIVKYLSAPPAVLKIRIEGHTDSIGSSANNRKLSQARADAIKAELMKRAVPTQIEIEAVGYGPDRPIADNGNFQGRQQNRRVEIRILRRLNEKAVEIR